MIELDPLTWFLLLEGLVVLFIAVVTGIWFTTRRDIWEQQAVKKVIDRLKKASGDHARELAEILMAFQNLPDSKRQELSATIQILENTLYHQIMKLFLQRDTTLLGQIDQRVRELTKPYHELLQALPPGEDAELVENLTKAEEEIKRRKMETEQLAKQLQVAMTTVENLSREYTRMFAPDRTQEEMEASRQKILDTLKQSERHLAQSARAEEYDDDLLITLVDDR